MAKASTRTRTRDAFDVTVNTRTTKEMQRRAQAAARALGVVPADVYRWSFVWWLKCYDAAGGRKLSDLEEKAALDGIAGVSNRLQEITTSFLPRSTKPIRRRRAVG